MSEFLTAEEVRDLTQRARREAQAQALTAAGIPHRIVGARIIVSRHHARAWLEGRQVAPSREPDMNAIR